MTEWMERHQIVLYVVTIVVGFGIGMLVPGAHLLEVVINPAIGLLLCASKDIEVVEYALSRTLSPALVAQYQTQLPDKEMLAAKLHEFYALSAPDVVTPRARKKKESKA